ncbi:MAG: curlin [Rhizobiaceae bacterium]|nr:curlin [Rhizobiaceae bacterium]MCV0408523.1 curlin [Rhizobiaceae bacterium]
MIRKSVSTLMAAAIAASLGSAALTEPAVAGGSFTIHVAPTHAEGERAIRHGLGLYSLYNSIKGGASIRQKGRDNTAGIGQNGGRNLGIIHQEGRGHQGTLQQNGSRNAYGLFQFGRNTSGHVTQNGNGMSGATFQWGW